MTSEEYLKFMSERFNDLHSLVKKKNADYTSGSSDAFANFQVSEEFGVDPLLGLALRMSDKFQRLKSYCTSGKLEVESEGVEDIFNDLIGYSFIALGMLEDSKKETTSEVDDNIDWDYFNEQRKLRNDPQGKQTQDS